MTEFPSASVILYFDLLYLSCLLKILHNHCLSFKVFFIISLFVYFCLVIKVDLLFSQIEQFHAEKYWFNYIKLFLECTIKQIFLCKIFFKYFILPRSKNLVSATVLICDFTNIYLIQQKPYYSVANNRKFRTSLKKKMLYP